MPKLNFRHKNLVIFSVLALVSLFTFQNCGRALFTLGTQTPLEAKSKTDFNELISNSDNEVRSTTDSMKSNDQLSPMSNTGRYTKKNALVKTPQPNKDFRMRLVRVRSARRKSLPKVVKHNVSKVKLASVANQKTEKKKSKKLLAKGTVATKIKKPQKIAASKNFKKSTAKSKIRSVSSVTKKKTQKATTQ